MKRMRMYLSLAVFSAVLPVVLWGVVSGQSTKLISRADQRSAIRVWFEPADIRLKIGESANIRVFSEYEDVNKIIPKVQLAISKPEGISGEPTNIVYGEPFSGKVNLGEIKLVAIQKGRFELKIIDDSVFTGLNDLDAVTFPAVIVVEN